jgi:hypothetical protein
MKALGLALLLTTGLLAQNRSGFIGTPGVIRPLGSVVQPGGTSAFPNIQRTLPGPFPGSGGPRIGVPGLQSVNPAGVRNPQYGGRGYRGPLFFPYPVVVGGTPEYADYYDPNAAGYPPMQQQQQQAPNITIIYPPAPAPVIMNPYASSDPGQYAAAPPAAPVVRPQAPPEPPAEEPRRYLIAFKDHTIYSAVAYWVSQDTLHYVTAGNIHNQVSLSLLDRELTERINSEPGQRMSLTPTR